MGTTKMESWRYLALILCFAALIWSNSHDSFAQEDAPPSIREVQAFLLEQGLDPGVVDGIYGSKTRLALESYQRRKGLQPTGIIDDPTISAMRRAQRTQQTRARPDRNPGAQEPDSSSGLAFWSTIFLLWLGYMFLKWVFKKEVAPAPRRARR